jgi:HPt (histidine-containing phosphotransfer) domain-containing protein
MTGEKQRGTAGRDGRGRFTKGNGHEFAKGQSGNPHGRPKSTTISDALRKRLAETIESADGKTVAELLADRLLLSARAGNLKAIREIADRAEGRPRQTVDVKADVSSDWREIARAHAIDEQDVLAEAQHIIESSTNPGGA